MNNKEFVLSNQSKMDINLSEMISTADKKQIENSHEQAIKDKAQKEADVAQSETLKKWLEQQLDGIFKDTPKIESQESYQNWKGSIKIQWDRPYFDDDLQKALGYELVRTMGGEQKPKGLKSPFDDQKSWYDLILTLNTNDKDFKKRLKSIMLVCKTLYGYKNRYYNE